MSQDRPEVLSRSVQETDVWLKELKECLKVDTPDQAYGALRAVLHALRDRLTVDMAAHLSAQLPAMLRGIFFDGWKPSKTPDDIRTPQEFIADVAQRARGHQEFDPNHAARGVLQLLERKMTPGQIEKIVEQLPEELKAYWRDQTAVVAPTFESPRQSGS